MIEICATTTEAIRQEIVDTLHDPVTSNDIRRFSRLFYDAKHTWRATHWRGVPVLKSPLDLWVLQELLWDVRPELVIECGTAFGGTALWCADVLEHIGEGGHVVTIDLVDQRHPAVRRRLPGSGLEFLQGDSIGSDTLAYLDLKVSAAHHVMVLLDSDHRAPHVLAELTHYSRYVSVGSFLVVEDTNLGHDVMLSVTQGPAEAVDRFLAGRRDFVREPLCERYLLSMHPGGWLKRVS